jgi:DNA-binding transcriptional regulator YdaS (Cro superfamily)
VVLACRFLGVDAVVALLDISAPSMAHYKNGNRTLPPAKFLALQAALRAAARFITRS